jgi:hypothetical protein
MTERSRTVREAHQVLMRDYARVLNKLSRLPPVVTDRGPWLSFNSALPTHSGHQPRRGESAIGRWLDVIGTWRFFVRIFVELHLYTVLAGLGRSYSFERESVTDQGKEYGEWLSAKETACQDLSDRLKSWQKAKLAASTIPAAVAAGWTLVPKFTNIQISTPKVHVGLGSIVLALLISGYILAFVQGAYRYQRELFLGGGWLLDKEIRTVDEAEALDPEGNVYAHEEALFSALGGKGPPEMRLDVVIVGLLALAAGIPLIVGAFRASAPNWNDLASGCLIVLVGGVLSYVTLSRR